MTTKIKFPYLPAAVALLMAVFASGGFALSQAQNCKREISQEIAACERQIGNLRRTNDELSLKIAEQVNPMRLIKRAASRLVQPNLTENIVWAYENFDGGRVEYSTKKSENVISFKLPKKK